MNDFRFAEPAWVHGVWAVAAVLAILIICEVRRSTAVARLLSSKMQQRLITIAPLGRRIVSHVLLCCAIAALIVALMRPQWGGVVQQLTAARSQIMICLDVSKSMLAEDVVPSRLERAKAEISALLALLDDSQQVGLIAFAGKATVLSPMTTDFGFLNLILKDTGPQSVGLGGTKIGDAIRTGTDGFRSAGDINRLLLVITDGEDHDSFPVDAAAYAREKGVRIVSIGFGDSAGSRIEITDPVTGTKQFLTDRNGEPVVSRLDDQSLREIALQTQGAYIPAGGGQLDLQSIYDSHISSMLKGTTTEQQRIVRNEGYQWCLLAALVMWAASLVLQVNRRIAPALLANAALALCICGLNQNTLAQDAPVQDSRVQQAQAAPSDTTNTGTLNQAEQGDSPAANADVDTGADQDAAPILAPREIYNLALGSRTGASQSQSAIEQAEEQLTDARNRAGVDGELRFRAVYNLGWLAADKASQIESDEPEEALKHLQVAVGRFREAVRLRPDNDEARFNLEVIAKRILVLKDRLSQQDKGTLEQQLDALIEKMRSHQTELKAVLAGYNDQQAPSKSVRAAFRSLGVTQRQIISDFYEFSERARAELDQVKSQASQPQANQSPPGSQSGQQPSVDPALRSAQITAMLGHIDLAMNWLQKARSFTRRIVPSSAFLRWSAAIRESRQARDQLRNPVEVLSVLLADSVRLNGLTKQFANETLQTKPRWLTIDYLTEEQLADASRTKQLLALLQSAVAEAKSQSASAADDDTGETPEEVLEQIESALPWIEEAAEHLDLSASKLSDADANRSVQSQRDAIEALKLAAEQFFDLRRLIEATYAQQLEIRETLSDRETVIDAQTLNLGRAERIENLLNRQIEQLNTAPETPTPSQPQAADASQSDAELARLSAGKQLLAEVRDAMRQVQSQSTTNEPQTQADEPPQPAATETLEGEPTTDDATEGNSGEIASGASNDSGDKSNATAASEVAPQPDSPKPADVAVERLAELRRLFFTLIEHLKDTAARQAELNQDTTTALSETNLPSDSADANERLGPLAERQKSLQTITQALADAFAEQSQQAGEVAPDSPEADQATQQGPTEKLKAAAELVDQASKQQALAATLLAPQGESKSQEQETEAHTDADQADADPPTPDSAQLEALKRLVEAIQLFDDQNQDQQDQQNQDDQQIQDSDQQDNQQQEQSSEQNPSQDQADQQRTASAEQLLQLIREQEAQRRRDKQKAQAASGTVDKDW